MGCDGMRCTAVDLIKFSDLAFVLSMYVHERESSIGTHTAVFGVYKLDIQAGRIVFLAKSSLLCLFADGRSDWSAPRSSLPLSLALYLYIITFLLSLSLSLYIYIYIYVSYNIYTYRLTSNVHGWSEWTIGAVNRDDGGAASDRY